MTPFSYRSAADTGTQRLFGGAEANESALCPSPDDPARPYQRMVPNYAVLEGGIVRDPSSTRARPVTIRTTARRGPNRTQIDPNWGSWRGFWSHAGGVEPLPCGPESPAQQGGTGERTSAGSHGYRCHRGRGGPLVVTIGCQTGLGDVGSASRTNTRWRFEPGGRRPRSAGTAVRFAVCRRNRQLPGLTCRLYGLRTPHRTA